MLDFDLVTIRRFNGVEDGAYSWTFLSYAIVMRVDKYKAVCLRNENIEYNYMPFDSREVLMNAYEKINVGDIKIFPAFNREYDCIYHKTKENLIDFVDNSGLYFDDDTTYGRDISQDEDSKANVKRKRIKMGKMQ